MFSEKHFIKTSNISLCVTKNIFTNLESFSSQSNAAQYSGHKNLKEMVWSFAVRFSTIGR